MILWFSLLEQPILISSDALLFQQWPQLHGNYHALLPILGEYRTFIEDMHCLPPIKICFSCFVVVLGVLNIKNIVCIRKIKFNWVYVMLHFFTIVRTLWEPLNGMSTNAAQSNVTAVCPEVLLINFYGINSQNTLFDVQHDASPEKRQYGRICDELLNSNRVIWCLRKCLAPLLFYTLIFLYLL